MPRDQKFLVRVNGLVSEGSNVLEKWGIVRHFNALQRSADFIRLLQIGKKEVCQF